MVSRTKVAWAAPKDQGLARAFFGATSLERLARYDCVTHMSLRSDQYSRFMIAVGGGCVAALMIAGCVAPTILPPPDLVPSAARAAFSDADWAEVLRRYVRGGLVDYDGLKKAPRPLDRYLATISVVGPDTTPHLFRTTADRLCYYINAYNALALRAVLEQWPTRTVYKLTLLPFQQRYSFTVDGQSLTLFDLRHRALQAGARDIRVLFTMSAAAMGSPELAAMPYRTIMLEQQLRRAAAWSLAHPAIVRVDHQQRTLLVGQVIFSHRQEFLDWYQRRYGTGNATLLNALSALADARDRQRFSSAVGYQIKMLPFDRSINSYARPSSSITPRKPAHAFPST